MYGVHQAVACCTIVLLIGCCSGCRCSSSLCATCCKAVHSACTACCAVCLLLKAWKHCKMLEHTCGSRHRCCSLCCIVAMGYALILAPLETVRLICIWCLSGYSLLQKCVLLVGCCCGCCCSSSCAGMPQRHLQPICRTPLLLCRVSNALCLEALQYSESILVAAATAAAVVSVVLLLW